MATVTEDIIINIEVEGSGSAESNIDDVTKSLEDNKDASGDAKDSVNEYSSSLVDSVKDTKVFGVSINSLSRGFNAAKTSILGANVGLKLFRTALIATGIGAIVVALGSLVAVLTKTQGGLDFVTKATDALGAIIGVVIDRLIGFGRGLISFFKGDFKEGIEQMGASFKGLGDDISAAVGASNELSDAFAELERRKVANIVADAKLRAEAQALFEITKDEDLAIGVRIKAARELSAVEAKRSGEAIAIAAEELRILQERNKLSESTLADTKAEAELEAELFRLKDENSKRNIKNLRELQTLQKMIITDEVEDLQDFSHLEIETVRATADEALKIRTDLSKSIRTLNAGDLKNVEITESEKVELRKLTTEESIRQHVDLFNAIAGLLGQESELGKAFAVTAAIINTAEAISKANTLVPPASFIGMAIAAANGLAQIIAIRGTPIPKVQTVSTPFAKGGDINGPGHARGGVWINAEGGEYMINKGAMRDPVNRAIVEGINQGQARGNMFQAGGLITQPLTPDLFNIEAAIQRARPILVLEDFDRAATNVRVTEELTTLQ